MKKMSLWLVMGLVLFMASCQNQVKQPAANEASADSTKPAVQPNIQYAYTIGHPADNWDRGSQENVAIVLNALKAFETGNVDECLKAFADSVHWQGDYYDAKISKDSLTSMFKNSWKNLASIKIDMSDFESVISKDKKDEYVGLWYKQKWTDKKGKTDSIYHMDDVKIMNGKIVELDEKTRHFPVPKKKM